MHQVTDVGGNALRTKSQIEIFFEHEHDKNAADYRQTSNQLIMLYFDNFHAELCEKKSLVMSSNFLIVYFHEGKYYLVS